MYTATTERIRGGRHGLQSKIRQIRRLVERAKRDPNFRASVARLLEDLTEKDHSGEIDRLVDYTRAGIRYLRDPWSPTGLELFIDPRTMMRDIEDPNVRASGDCDDHVILASALIETAGYPTRYVVGGVPPEDYKHIWIEVRHPQEGWLPIELTKKDVPVGWDPAPRFPLVETYRGGKGGSMNALGNLQYPQARRAPQLRRPFRPRQTYAPPPSFPASFHNVWEDTALYAGATPSDFFRATEIRYMLPEGAPLRYSPLLGLDYALGDWDELAGLSRYFKKARRAITRPIKKYMKVTTGIVKKFLPEIVGVAGTVVGGPMLGVTAMQTVGGMQAQKEAEKAERRAAAAEAAALAEQVNRKAAADAAARRAAEIQNARVAAERRERIRRANSLPTSIYSTLPGPSFYQASGGFALPPGAPDQVAILDQEPRIAPVRATGVPPMAVAAAAGIPLLFLLMRGIR